MCDTCGCGRPENEVRITKPGEKDTAGSYSDGHSYRHSHKHSHGGEEHSHEHEHENYHTHDHDGEQDHGNNQGHGNGHIHRHGKDWGHGHDYGRGQEHDHNHIHSPSDNTSQEYQEYSKDSDKNVFERKIAVEQDVISKNNLLAERNRGYFEAKGIKAINLVSSPGSGKTSLLERTIRDLKKEISIYVIEGDQQTMNDANRIDATGAPVVQINTGEGCHLDADMVNKAVKKLEPAENSLLMIENVGNLVCPALFDLGETYRVVIMSVTEGEDKPVKYPYMFRTSDLCIINKTDLLPYVDFNLSKAKEYAKQINPELKIIEISVKTGEGVNLWYEWINSI
jgi:hydrogenase nickel incorporation protein HypB